MTSVKSIQTTILDTPPSCIEVCPWDPSLVAIGTYLLHKNEDEGDDDGSQPGNESTQSQKRTGTVELFRLSEDHSSLSKLDHRWCDYAILDLHFPCVDSDNDHSFWTANSMGSLTRHVLDASGTSIEKQIIAEIWEPDVLVLSFTFHPTNAFLFGATLSDGTVSIVHFRSYEFPDMTSSMWEVSRHDLEAWTMSFDLNAQRCLSGGDDIALQCTALNSLALEDFNKGFSDREFVEPMLEWKNRRIHQAGVTAMLPLEEDIILTGSYDDHIRVLSIAKPPKLLAELRLGGGVWRLKLLNTHETATARHYDILASCMHAGARIVRITLFELDTEPPDIRVLAKFEEHESMNYGSDFVRTKDESYDYTILSTSFYDKRLCLWKFSAPALATS